MSKETRKMGRELGEQDGIIEDLRKELKEEKATSNKLFDQLSKVIHEKMDLEEKLKEMDPHPNYIGVYHPIAGWKAIEYYWREEANGYEPWSTSFFAYLTRAEAVKDAESWALAEEVEFRDS